MVKLKQPGNSPAAEQFAQARKYFVEGDFQEAMRALGWGFKQDVNYLPLYRLAADSLEKLEATDEKGLFEAVISNINDPDAFNNLGNLYFGFEDYDVAQAFFEKTIQLDPENQEATHDLAICYARRFQISKAIEVLTNTPAKDFWNVYFLNKCKILDRKIEGVQETINELLAGLKQQTNKDELEIPAMKIDELQETLQRFLTVPNAQNHIRDWQFIQYGSAMLYFHEQSDDDYVAGGRYVSLGGSKEGVKQIANNFKQFIAKLSISFKSVVSLTDRDSEIIGRLLAKEFGVVFNFYDPAKTNQDCLIVSADTANFEEHEELNSIRNGQIVFALNHNWLSSSMVTPDIIAFMAQSYNFPWTGGGLRITDMEKKTIERVAPDHRAPEEIAQDIFMIDQPLKDINKDLDFYSQRKDYLKGIGKKANKYRYNFMVESPVSGSYFG